MSTSLFARLSRRYGPKPGVDGPTRREFLAATLAASAGVMLSTSSGFGMLRQVAGGGGAKRVVVVGAGFAGLACAFELLGAGYDVTVVEARNRLGGRVLSFNDFVPGKNVEGGGELVGSNHPTWVAYAARFGLEFIDVTEDEKADLPVLLDGKVLTAPEAKELWEQMEKATSRMNADAEAINADQPWLSPKAGELDNRTTQAWIDSLGLEPLCKKAVTIELAGNNGQSCEKQSYLGNLTQVKGGGVEKYWTDSEVYRCKGGNQQLAFRLGEAVGARRINLGLPVRSITSKGRDGCVVECADGRTIECDEVVMTAPPTTWGKIEFRPGLPADLNPQMGVNVKYLSRVKSQFWKAKNISPWALTDGQVSLTWDGTDNQYPEGNPGEACLTAFSGGPAAEKARMLNKDEVFKNYAEQLEKLYPGYKENVLDTRFMDWPSENWTQGGYSFPAPGQVTRVGPVMERGLPNIHFAGEATCYKFVGYMEGGLNSGASVARKIAQRDGLWKPAATAPATQKAK